MNTDINTKTKEQIIYELLLSLNRGNTGFADNRPLYAIEQYYELIKQGIIKEHEV